MKELSALNRDASGREPTVREKTAAASFMAQFYSGIENILKRISRFHEIPLPTGDTWHNDLFKRFCAPSYKSLPELFDNSLALSITPYRKFRHVVFHGYGFQLEWNRMKEGIEHINDVFSEFKIKLSEYMMSLKEP